MYVVYLNTIIAQVYVRIFIKKKMFRKYIILVLRNDKETLIILVNSS